MTGGVITALLVLAAAYAAILSFFATGLLRLFRSRGMSPQNDNRGGLATVSVIVAARNEEASIESCLESILASEYPPELLEVLVVDDDSTDRTTEAVRRVQRRLRVHGVLAAGIDAEMEFEDRLRLVGRRAGRGHKVHAVADGIRAARGEIILTTDADCTVGPGWIRAMIGSFDSETGFVAGPVQYAAGKNLFAKAQALEFAGLIGVGAGSVAMGHPILCSSANIAYRRSLYLDLAGQSTGIPIAAGHDEILIQRVARESKFTVRFCAERDAIVTTEPARTLSSFIAQRRRWAATGASYPGRGVLITQVILFAFFVVLATSLPFALFDSTMALALMAVFGIKTVADLSILAPMAYFFGVSRLALMTPMLQIPHVLYILVAVLTGVPGGHRWKDRPHP
jgi:cellulose synthase/poly-beta-1,6-N-acetylglucosamine synthase-like glycosyltransferase